uniref:Uncharacterized protein n=1 Tax=Arundo donax TaxID=35708 RepID=A0A0A9DH04_ARUDO
MEGAKRREEDQPENAYELVRRRRIDDINVVLRNHRLTEIATELSRKSKRARHALPNEPSQPGHNEEDELNASDEEDDHVYNEEHEHNPSDEEDEHNVSDEEEGYEDIDPKELLEPKRRRGCTRMESFWLDDEETHEKIKIDYNEYFQPIGAKVPKLSNLIGTLVKGKVLSMAYDNWTRVRDKEDVWTGVKRYFDLDECLKDHVMKSAHKKWKDFKNRLKTKHFNPELSDQELLLKRDSRVSEPNWKWLIAFWRSEKGEACSKCGKENHAKMGAVHTIGTRSLANVHHDLEKKKGRKVSRAEVYKVAYTRKDGRPQPACQQTLAQIDEKFK